MSVKSWWTLRFARWKTLRSRKKLLEMEQWVDEMEFRTRDAKRRLASQVERVKRLDAAAHRCEHLI